MSKKRNSRSSEPDWVAARKLFEGGASMTAIAKQLGVSTSSVSRAARRDAWTRNVPAKEREQQTAAAAAARRKWPHERLEEAERAAGTAMVLRSAVTVLVQRSLAPTVPGQGASPLDSRALRDLAVAYGIFVDKAQLLSGAPTERFETLTPEEAATKVAGLLDELKARRNRREDSG